MVCERHQTVVARPIRRLLGSLDDPEFNKNHAKKKSAKTNDFAYCLNPIHEYQRVISDSRENHDVPLQPSR